MSKTVPIDVPSELLAEAGAVSEVMNRSVAQQIAHWARVGREVELAASVSVQSLRAVFAGRRSYDELSGEEQAVVRAQWAERMDVLRGGLVYTDVFSQQERSSVELDDESNVVRREPDSAHLDR
jgi:hypothetical protein